MTEITYQDIAQVNAELNFTDVKGKMYAEVPQRVKAFRMLYPRGYIITDMISNADGVCVFKATAGYYGENGEAYTLGTGTAYEREGSSFINKTSYIENCETSAVGRALGFLGLGSETSIASAEEVANAINNQGTPKTEPPKPTFSAMNAVKAFCEKKGIDGNMFTSMRNACIEAGLLRRIAYGNMTEAECKEMIRCVEMNMGEGK